MKKNTMNTVGRVLIVAGALIYVLSPIDALPGPFDDIAVAVLGIVFQRVVAKRKSVAQNDDDNRLEDNANNE